MDAVTYPEPSVALTINERFVPLQINVQVESAQPVLDRYRQFWTPEHRILGADGFSLYNWNGYLPPFEFLPQLLVGQAQALLRLRDEPGAASIYQDVVRRFPTSRFAAEAQYFLAVATYKARHDVTDLVGGWKRLQTRYPDSLWRMKQSFAEERRTREDTR